MVAQLSSALGELRHFTIFFSIPFPVTAAIGPTVTLYKAGKPSKVLLTTFNVKNVKMAQLSWISPMSKSHEKTLLNIFQTLQPKGR